MKILVSGGAGFIGSHVVDALIEENNEVCVVDNLSTGSRNNLNKKAKFYEVDITSPALLEEVFVKEKPEVIFHLAAQASVPVSIDKPVHDIKTNVIGTVNLLELAEKHGVKKFIFSSSGGTVYGDDVTRPTIETARTDPMTPYGLDKFFGESYVRYFASRSSLNYVILRYSNVYGPRQDPLSESGVVAIFTMAMLKNEPFTIYGNGEQTRDYIYVGDVIEGNLAALRSPVSGVYNIATGLETSVNELSDKLIELTDSKIHPSHGPARPEQHASSLSSEKAYLELGWKSKTSLDEGLKKTVDFFRLKG
jgi:UDP-glucose 4-epimerase